MRVLILATDIYTRGGIARYTATLASALGQVLGPENVHLLALLDWGCQAEAPKDFKVVGVVGKSINMISKLRFGLRAMRLGRRKHDLVIAGHVALAPLAAVLHFWYGTPFWVACYGFEVWQRLPPLKLAAVKRAALVYSISQFTAQRLREANGIEPSKIKLLYNAIPAEFAALLTSPSNIGGSAPVRGGDERLLLSVGSLSQGYGYKGIDTVIRALPKIREAVPSVRYVVVGKGGNRANLEKLAAQTGVAQQVTFVGEVSDPQLAALYRACDVFILPSRCQERNGDWGGEGFGRVYLEAALAGKPVVGSNMGGAAEAVLHGKTGLLVDPRSVAEVAEAVVTLLQSWELAAAMGAQGRQWALENFSVAAMRQRLTEMLRVL
jgi:glycosyltransferase involved in cell wall biosynthesis